MLHFLNIFFFVFHLSLVLFNLFGWIWKPLRRAHLIVVCLTLASWTILGIWYGFGYCPLTELHWQVLEKLGKTGLPNSYLKYLFDTLTGLDWNAELVDTAAGVGIVLALLASVWVNFFKKTPG
jgi:hypothetical protein